MNITLSKLRTFDQSQLDKIFKLGDKFKIIKFLDEWGLHVVNKKVIPKDEYKTIWGDLYKYYDKKQLVTKISLNSAFLIGCL